MKAHALNVRIFMILTAALLVLGPQAQTLKGQSAGAPCPGSFTCNTWKGPGDQTATGPEFSIDTQGLSPGYHEITLLALNTRGQTARGAARLEVTIPLPPLTVRIHPEFVRVMQGGQARPRHSI